MWHFFTSRICDTFWMIQTIEIVLKYNIVNSMENNRLDSFWRFMGPNLKAIHNHVELFLCLLFVCLFLFGRKKISIVIGFNYYNMYVLFHLVERFLKCLKTVCSILPISKASKTIPSILANAIEVSFSNLQHATSLHQ